MNQEKVSFLTYFFQDFPGGPIVKIPPRNSGYVGLIPDQGTKNPPAVGQLSPYGTTKPLWYNLAHALLTPPQQ